MLYDGEEYPFTRGLEADGSVWLAFPAEDRGVRYALDGSVLDEVEGYPYEVIGRCQTIDYVVPLAEIDGRRYQAVCGEFSPDGASMLYYVNIDNPGTLEGRYEAWLLHIESGQRTLLTDALRHCGGCDGRRGAGWSPSSRYVSFGETYAGDDSAVYLADAVTGTTRKIAEGSAYNSITTHLTWSPADDALLRPTPVGTVAIERLATGEAIELRDVRWPAWFDRSGAYIFWLDAGATVIADATTGDEVARWEGEPPWTWPAYGGITQVLNDPAALLETRSGTRVHHPSRPVDGELLADGFGATWSADGSTVAFARPTKPEALGEGGTRERQPWDILLFDVPSGVEREIATGAVSDVPPLIRWNEDGTHILVQWPGPSGI